VSSRETVIEFVRKLPEEMSLVEIAREVELLAGIQNAREQARRKEGVTEKDARKLVDSWASQNGFSIPKGSNQSARRWRASAYAG
jgi:hypothetical protein